MKPDGSPYAHPLRLDPLIPNCKPFSSSNSCGEIEGGTVAEKLIHSIECGSYQGRTPYIDMYLHH